MILTKARSLLSRSAPDWLNTPVNSSLLQNLKHSFSISPPLNSELRIPNSELSPLPHRPHWRRIAKVYAALDQARAQNPKLPTYSALCRHVQDQTGTACSRKLISKWKLDRGLR